MSRNQKRMYAVLGIIAVIFTIVSFAIPTPRSSGFWIAWVFGLVAVGAQVYVMKTAFHGAESPKSKYYGFPVASIGIIYMCIQLVLSLIFIALARWVPSILALVLFAVLLGAAAIGFIAADAAREEVVRQEDRRVADTSTMKALREKSARIAGICGDKEVKSILEELAEEFRYSDPVSSEATREMETELGAELDTLENSVKEKNGNVVEICQRVKEMLTERNRICKSAKK